MKKQSTLRLRQVIVLLAFALVSLAASSGYAQRTIDVGPDFDPARPDPNYEITRVAEGMVLTNKVSGQSWWLFVEPARKGAKDKKPNIMWLPVSRVDDYAAVAKWLRGNRRRSTERVLQVEVAFAKKQLQIARKEYGSRHPIVVKLADDMKALLKEQNAVKKRNVLLAALKKKLAEEKAGQQKQNASGKMSKDDEEKMDKDSVDKDSSADEDLKIGDLDI